MNKNERLFWEEFLKQSFLMYAGGGHVVMVVKKL